jgi:hypothetical protein
MGDGNGGRRRDCLGPEGERRRLFALTAGQRGGGGLGHDPSSGWAPLTASCCVMHLERRRTPAAKSEQG